MRANVSLEWAFPQREVEENPAMFFVCCATARNPARLLK